jgi:hypothetical protein
MNIMPGGQSSSIDKQVLVQATQRGRCSLQYRHPVRRLDETKL